MSGQEKTHRKGCLSDNILPTVRVYPCHTASSVVCTSQGRHLQSGISVFLLLLAFRHCHFFLMAVSCVRYIDILEPIFQVQQQKSRFWQKCPLLHLALAGAFMHPNVLRDQESSSKGRFLYFRLDIDVKNHSYFPHANFLFECCRSFNITLQLKRFWPRGDHGAGTARQMNSARSWGLIQNAPK